MSNWDELWKDESMIEFYQDDKSPWNPALFVLFDKIRVEGDKLQGIIEDIKDYRRVLFSQPKGTMMDTKLICKVLGGLIRSSEFKEKADDS